MKYKALFLDVDDTLLCNSRQVSKGNLEAIRRAQDAGIFVTIATGRGFLGSTGVWKQFDVEGPVIVYGGAMIVDTRTQETMRISPIEPSLIREALLYAKELGIHAQIYQGDTIIFEQVNEFTDRYLDFLHLPYIEDPEFINKEWQDTPKVLAYAEPGEQERAMAARFRERFAGRLEVASSKPGFIELNQYGVNKGTALVHTAGLLGILPEETVAVGDNTLDLQMVQMAGLGVCVGNGQQVVKDVADVIAPACADDGVAWVIDHILLSEEGSERYQKRNHIG